MHDLAMIEFEGPDSEQAARFFCDFGLTLERRPDKSLWFTAEAGAPVAVVYRPAKHPRFIGPTFAVRHREDLAAFAAKLPEAEVTTLPLPGEPLGVSLKDPNGVGVKVAWFEDWREVPDCGEAPSVNRGDQRPRINDPRRPARKASRVLRLGHMVLGAPNWETTTRFYIDTLGLIPSDVQALPDGRPSVAFMRCDRGDAPTDHHTFVVARLPVVDLEHAAFEVPDLDEVGMGGRILGESGFRRAWGIGRHILGSQIFDYWFGPDGYKFEHFADGDLFDAARPTGYHAMSAAGLSQWGPDMPSVFLRPRTHLREILKLIKSVFGRSEFGIRELRLFGTALRSSSLPD
ncbi:putative metapyrocatechase 2 [gamma proteobacterium NOR5-3]|nr:putative metapyrocatechase 2 [gamma proteobacterium NOR5-3]